MFPSDSVDMSGQWLLSAGKGGASVSLSWLLLLGVLLVVAAVLWRGLRAAGVRRKLRTGLRSADPAVRIDAVHQAGELGLATTAPLLLRLVASEPDRSVLAAVIRTVAGRQWEPASTARLVELRLWARAFVEAHPELRRAENVGEPLLPGVGGVATVPSLDPARAIRYQRGSDAISVPVPLEQRRTELEDPDALGPVRVLVTGAGGPAGVAVIQDLRKRGHYVIAVDADPNAVGLRLADEHAVVPYFNDPVYVAALVRAATVANAQALICTVAEEYPALVAGGSFLEEAHVRLLLPSLEAAQLCTDKWQFAECLRAAGLCSPATGLGTADGVPGPWVVKPRFGRGSREVFLCSTRRELDDALRRCTDPIVQTMVTGREFTCDVLMDPSGALAGGVARWRVETRAGISTKGETFDNADVLHLSGQVLKAVGLIGPANVQGFVSEDGSVVVHEVNPRFSGGLPLSLAAGADLVEEYLRAVMGASVRPERLVARPGVKMLRYFSEVFEG
ncbi:MAG: carbamoyl-phosphate synthase large subunit [Frankiales bacterium]|nr:carbamoyl-phosphate synthase large subunit [Frankiales bacterium]